MRSAILLLALACGACASPTDDSAATRDMRGVWAYNGGQASPVLTVRGTLRIDQQSGSDFSGTAEFSETDVQGTQTNRAGVLSGRVVGNSAVDFDIYIENAPRRHVAALLTDSIAGTWARTGATPVVTGSFSARKQP